MLVSHPTKEKSIGLLELRDGVTMQFFGRTKSAMMTATSKVTLTESRRASIRGREVDCAGLPQVLESAAGLSLSFTQGASPSCPPFDGALLRRSSIQIGMYWRMQIPMPTQPTNNSSAELNAAACRSNARDIGKCRR